MRLPRLLSALLAVSLAASLSPVRADYVGGQAGGGGNITYGAFAPTIGGVVTQLTKSVPVDPTTGQAIFTSSLPGLVQITSQPLPTGASTSALQTSGNTSLSSIDTKTPALVSGRVPVDGSGVTQPTDTIVRSTSVDRGAVLTTASTAVTLVPANTARRGLAIQNRNAPGSSYNAATSVYYTCLGTATNDFHSLEVPAGALYETPSHHSGTGACSFFSPTANTPVYIREF